MSLKSEEQISMNQMSASDKLAQAPRLASGGIGYSAWRDNMHVYLQRAGAEGIHCKVMKEEAWVTMTRSAEEWASDELASALAVRESSTLLC
jgi:hypothetical protein